MSPTRLFRWVDPASAMVAALKAIVYTRHSRDLPAHKRLYSRRATATCSIRRGDFSLTVAVQGRHHEDHLRRPSTSSMSCPWCYVRSIRTISSIISSFRRSTEFMACIEGGFMFGFVAWVVLYAAALVGAAPGTQNPPTTPRRGATPQRQRSRMLFPIRRNRSRPANARMRGCAAAATVLPVRGDGRGAGAGGKPSDSTDAVSVFGLIPRDLHRRPGWHLGRLDSYAEQVRTSDIWNLVNFIRSIGPQPK